MIEQARGAVAQAHHISVDEAFAHIRTYAQGNDREFTEVAHAIVADRTGVPDLI